MWVRALALGFGGSYFEFDDLIDELGFADVSMTTFSPDSRVPNRWRAWWPVGLSFALTAATLVVWLVLTFKPFSAWRVGWDWPGANRAAAIDGHATRAMARESTSESESTEDPTLGPLAGATRDTDGEMFAAFERLERRMAAAIARARESVVSLEYSAADVPTGPRRLATGVVINHRGEVLSVRIDQPPSTPPGISSLIVARDFSGRRYSAQWIAADPETGLTLLRVPPKVVRPIQSTSRRPSLGSQICVVGNPFGMGHSVSRGHVAGLDRALELGTRQLGGLIQVEVPLYPGDSGAAVVNLHGDWLGIIRSGMAVPASHSRLGSDAKSTSASAPLADSPGAPPSASLSSSSSSSSLSSITPADLAVNRPGRDAEFGFAIPVQDALWVSDQLRTRGRVDRAYLGVRLERSSLSRTTVVAGPDQGVVETSARIDVMIPATETHEVPSAAPAKSGDRNGNGSSNPGRGAVVREILSGTPASQAGLRPGDDIVELDGRPIRSAHDLTDRLDRIPSQTTVLLGVIRQENARRQRILVSLCTASRPEEPQQPARLSPPTQESNRALALGSSGPATTPIPSGEKPPAPQPSDLRLMLPPAIVERLEKLERRLEKLEAFPAYSAAGARESVDRQIGSSRVP